MEEIPTTFTCHWVCIGRGKLTLWHRIGRGSMAQLTAFGCDHVVTLLSAREGGHHIGEHVEQLGIKWTWLPLENGNPPQGDVASSIISALAIFSQGLDEGESILIHCSAGIHRTGMIGYALLRWRGYSEEEALDLIAEMRLHTRAGLRSKHIEWGNRAIILKSLSQFYWPASSVN